MKTTILQKVICVFFSFILCIALVLAALSIAVKSTVLNKDFLLNQLSISGYHVKAAEYAKKNIAELAFVGGVPSEIFDSIITTERTNSDVTKIFETAFDGTQYSIDSDALKQEFIETIENYAAENDIDINDETNSNITHLSEQCAQLYIDCINIAGLNTVIATLRQPAVFINFALAATALVIIISVVMLYLVNKYKHKFFRYIFYALGGAILMLSVIPGYFLLSKPYKNLNISPDYLHSFINSYIDDTLKAVLVAAAFFLVLIIIVSILIGFFKKRAIKKGIKERTRSSMV